jgi:hypothetical protein
MQWHTIDGIQLDSLRRAACEEPNSLVNFGSNDEADGQGNTEPSNHKERG